MWEACRVALVPDVDRYRVDVAAALALAQASGVQPYVAGRLIGRVHDGLIEAARNSGS